jgi:hypothetical protein
MPARLTPDFDAKQAVREPEANRLFRRKLRVVFQ